ncbi:MAG: hypothetical protein KIT68_10105 [Phycisphaeraceae bacterium]|nr:hypothetical protein [Phycisphaeraceae bacterium]
MSTAVAQAKLRDAVRELQFKWVRIRESWDDDAAAALERDLIQPLPPRMNAAMGAMGRIGELMVTIRRECGDEAG